MERGYVLAIGEALIDAVSTGFVEDLSFAQQLELKPGGSPANLCRFLHSLGTPARLIASVGDDGLAKIILRDMEQKGIDTSNIQVQSQAATTIILVGKSRGTPDFIAYRDADKTITEIAAPLIEDCQVIHTTSFALSCNPAQTTILQALAKARRLGKKVSVDWNYAQKIWGPGNNANEVFAQLVTLQPFVKCSLDDVERYAGIIPDAAEAKAFLEQFPTSVTCLTCGADGVWYKKGSGGWEYAPAIPVDVKDSTGAGDAFWAGFLHATMLGEPLKACVEKALQTAALRLEGKLT